MDEAASILFFAACFSATATLLYLAYKLEARPAKIILTILSLVIPIVISGIRYNVGIDFPEYEKIFNNIIAGREAWDHILEPTFYLFSWISDFLTHNSVILFTIYAGIFVSFSYLFITKVVPRAYVPLTYFVMLLTIFPMSMNVVRQSAAVAVCAFAVWFIINKKPAKFIITVLLASTLHFSAIILLPLYLINLLFKKLDMGLKKVYITLAVVAILCILAPFILQLLAQIPILNHYLYLSEFDQSFYVSGRLLANLFIIVLVWWFARKSIVSDRIKLIITTLLAIGICLQTIGFFMRGASRISLYLTSLLPIVLVYLTAAEDKKYLKPIKKVTTKKYFWPIIIIAISLIYFVGICLFDNSGYDILPYQTIF